MPWAYEDPPAVGLARSSLAKDGISHVEGSVCSEIFGGRFGRCQPMKQGSCFQR
jgi:hypothetical protein